MTLKQDNPLSPEVEAELKFYTSALFTCQAKGGNINDYEKYVSKLTKLLLEQRIKENQRWVKIYEEIDNDLKIFPDYSDSLTKRMSRQVLLEHRNRLTDLESELSQLDKEKYGTL